MHIFPRLLSEPSHSSLPLTMDFTIPPPSRRLRRLPSHLTLSLASGTDSTTSGIPGPGRALGALLSAYGKRVESILSRTAQYMGFGPHAIVQRILAVLHKYHAQRCPSSPELLSTSMRSSSTNPSILIGRLLELCAVCRRCRCPHITETAMEGECTLLLTQLLKYTK